MAQKALVDHVCAGRSDQVRMPTEDELGQTTILGVPLEEASAKVRTGPPKDDETDHDLPVWAGVLPMSIVPQAPRTTRPRRRARTPSERDRPPPPLILA